MHENDRNGPRIRCVSVLTRQQCPSRRDHAEAAGALRRAAQLLHNSYLRVSANAYPRVEFWTGIHMGSLGATRSGRSNEICRSAFLRNYVSWIIRLEAVIWGLFILPGKGHDGAADEKEHTPTGVCTGRIFMSGVQ